MNKNPKFFWHYDVLTGHRIKFAEVTIYNEPMNIRGYSFKMDNVYDVPANEVNDKDAYQQPLDDPLKNVNKAFSIYRNRMGLLDPIDIKAARHQLQLSQPEVASILGMSYATLSNIENNHIIQSISQDTELRNLFNGPALIQLIKARLPAIKSKKMPHVKVKDLKNTIKLVKDKEDKQKILNNNQMQEYKIMKKLPLNKMIKAYYVVSHSSPKQLTNNINLSKTELDEVTRH